MAHVRDVVSRGEYPAEVAREILSLAARGPVALRWLSGMTGVDLHQQAFRDRIHVREVPNAPEMLRFEVSSEDAIFLLLRHGPSVFAKEFGKIVSGSARLKRGFADLIGCPELRPGPREVR
jgi:hypothetical protein